MSRATYPTFALAGVFVVSALGVAFAAGRDDRDDLLPRSLYLPIEFELCEHLHDAVLYQGGQAVSHMPAKRIFQFTYYPKLGRMAPVRTDVEVAGLRDDGEEFLAKLAITPWGVFTANHKIELDLEEQLARMKYKIDVRYKAIPLKLQCDDSCEERKPTTPKAALNEQGTDTIRE